MANVWRNVDWDREPLSLSAVRQLPPARGQIVGTLYCFQALGSCLFKVGFSVTPNARLEAIQPYSPLPLRFVACWYPATRGLEADVHTLLRMYHSHGEWFDLRDWLKDDGATFDESWNEVVAEALDPSGWQVRPIEAEAVAS